VTSKVNGFAVIPMENGPIQFIPAIHSYGFISSTCRCTRKYRSFIRRPTMAESGGGFFALTAISACRGTRLTYVKGVLKIYDE
jgi:hypothetical protein